MAQSKGQEMHTPTQRERDVAWRAESLLRGPWRDSVEFVMLIAENLDIDYREAVYLRGRGCPAELAFEILA